jgi:hypothetical protein
MDAFGTLLRERGRMPMGYLLVMLLVFLAVLAVLLGLSVGIAFLIEWLLPAVGMGMALLVAVIAVGQAMLIFGRMISTLSAGSEPQGESVPPSVILDREVTLPHRRRKGA